MNYDSERDKKSRKAEKVYPYTGLSTSVNGEVFLSVSDRKQLDRIEEMLRLLLSEKRLLQHVSF